jgi:3-deoxy-manno-octulosonate cytidylyltransferase (CMP-KDO synthetase)
MKIIGIIPARFASSRFPGKPLVDIGGKTMIRRVYEQSKKAKLLTDVIVATDDKRIFDEVKNFGGNVMMTAAKHTNGTERCAEIAKKIDADFIINIQGDEPFIHPAQIDQLAKCLTNTATRSDIATLITPTVFDKSLENQARIKVTVNKTLEAIYFSRSVIPFVRNKENLAKARFFQHVGIYGFKRETLLHLVKLKSSHLELSESLEQLRWLENGFSIQCAITKHQSHSVDTPADLKKLIKQHFGI